PKQQRPDFPHANRKSFTVGLQGEGLESVTLNAALPLRTHKSFRNTVSRMASQSSFRILRRHTLDRDFRTSNGSLRTRSLPAFLRPVFESRSDRKALSWNLRARCAGGRVSQHPRPWLQRSGSTLSAYASATRLTLPLRTSSRTSKRSMVT